MASEAEDSPREDEKSILPLDATTLYSFFNCYEVSLRVYDISHGHAQVWSPWLIGQRIQGIWHTGVEVFGREYFYGGGVFKIKPGDMTEVLGLKPCMSVFIGATSVPKNDFERYVMSVAGDFTPDKYDLLKWNCNHFSDTLCRFLVNRGIPRHILELPQIVQSRLAGRLLLGCIQTLSRQRQSPVTLQGNSYSEDSVGGQWHEENYFVSDSQDVPLGRTTPFVTEASFCNLDQLSASTTDVECGETDTSDDESLLSFASSTTVQTVAVDCSEGLNGRPSFLCSDVLRENANALVDRFPPMSLAESVFRKKQSEKVDSQGNRCLFIDLKGSLPVGCPISSPNYPRQFREPEANGFQRYLALKTASPALPVSQCALGQEMYDERGQVNTKRLSERGGCHLRRSDLRCVNEKELFTHILPA